MYMGTLILKNMDWFFAYTRKQAIADGVLVDLMQGEFGELVKEAGFKDPMAMTATAFSKFVELTPAAERAGNDIKGRLFDVLVWLMHALRRDDGKLNPIVFGVPCFVDKPRAEWHVLKAVMGADDDGKPCFTLMLPDED